MKINIDKIKSNIKIYLDIDGVLFYRNKNSKNRLCLRPNFSEFLYFLSDNFNYCFWLTYWKEKDINTMLKNLYLYDISQYFKYVNWNINGNYKIDSINMNDDFIWIEDEKHEYETNMLIKNNKLSNFIQTHFWQYPNDLIEVQEQLTWIIKHRKDKL